jgi:hypothetical protein
MQEVWQGKGDHKLIYKRGGKLIDDDDDDDVDETKSPYLIDTPYTILKQYGNMCIEEKFTVLPYEIRLYIAELVKGWVEKSPAERFCAADSLVGSLALMAHGTHQIYLSFDRFLNCTFDDVKLIKVLRCYKNCVPEPGTYFGEIVAQFFQHCKQQTNLNVKRTTRGSVDKSYSSSSSSSSSSAMKTDDGPSQQTMEIDSTQQNEEGAALERFAENVDTICDLLDVSFKKVKNINTDNETDPGEVTDCRQKRQDKPTASMDRKFEVIMSLKRAATVVLMFMCKQERVFTSDSHDVLESYLKKKLFGVFLNKNNKSPLDTVPHEFSIKQFDNTESGEVYFSLTVHSKFKHEKLIDDLLASVDIHNASCENGVDHHLGVCTLIYCSDTLYFMGMSQSLFIENSVTFLYCFLTEKYRPVIESKEDSFVFGLVKILSSIEYFTECSLKRNHAGKVGHGPLTSVISEGGLNESLKFVNNTFRRHFLDDSSTPGPSVKTRGEDEEEEEEDNFNYEPMSPSYAPDSQPEVENGIDCCVEQNINSDIKVNGPSNARRYVINEPYIKTFLNMPPECGSMY